MTLDNINVIGYDLTHEVNEFNEPKLLSDIEIIKNAVIFILMATPGQYPSLPTIGLGLEDFLYEFYDELDTGLLEEQIISQCKILGVYFNRGNISIKKLKYNGVPSMLIYISGNSSYPRSYKTDRLDKDNEFMIGVTYDQFKNIMISINE